MVHVRCNPWLVAYSTLGVRLEILNGLLTLPGSNSNRMCLLSLDRTV